MTSFACRKRSLFAFVLGLAMVCAFFANSNVGAAESFAGLKSWVNKYPWDLENSKNLFQTPELATALTELLPEKEYEFLTRKNMVEIPIEAVGGYLLVARCMPHCCPCENVLLVVGLHDNSLLALFWNQTDQSTRCFSTGPRIADLPDAIKEKYLDMHIVRKTESDRLLPKNLWLDRVECGKRENR